MSKITVLGANGFIGRNLVLSLASDTSNTITAFGRFSSYQHEAGHPFDNYDNIMIRQGDFFSKTEVSSAIDGADYVFHLISATNPAIANDDPFIDIETNIKPSVELLQACSQHNVKKLIFLSSGGTVYGDIDSDSINEKTLAEPRSPYGISKLTIEHYLRYFKYVHGLDYIVYRVANPYGSGQNIHGKQGVIPIFMNQIIEDQPITIYGDGEMVRDYIYIDDLIEMIIGSFAKNNQHNEYNLGSGQGKSVNELVTALEKCSGKTVTTKSAATPSTFIDRSVLDITRFVEEFGIAPHTELEQGIERTWEYVKTVTQ